MREERNILHKLMSTTSPFIPTFKILDLEDIREYSRVLADKVSAVYEPDVVVGIANAGLYPAFEVSSNLSCGMDSMHITHYYTKSHVLCDVPDPSKVIIRALSFLRNLVVGTEAKSKSVLLRDTKSKSFEDEKILVIDDDSGSGKTMELAKEILKRKNPKTIKTATIFKLGNYKTDFFVREKSVRHLIYPWRKASPYYEEYLQKMSEIGLNL